MSILRLSLNEAHNLYKLCRKSVDPSIRYKVFTNNSSAIIYVSPVKRVIEAYVFLPALVQLLSLSGLIQKEIIHKKVDKQPNYLGFKSNV